MRGRSILILGDIISLAIITVIGFASHGTAGSAGTRMLTTFLPLVASWFLVAPFLGVYDAERVRDIKQIWRPFWAMVLAGPFAAWMRGAWLNAPILPLFVVVLGGTGALGILTWRVIYFLTISRKR
jgi:asparagine N-glycosylation enzyme membrane subunit Stt3